jgi:UTP-glucose-1-phosphate uridylyltransferase
MLPIIQLVVKNILIKPDNEMLFLDQYGMRKKIMNFLSDCPELIQKLKEKDKELKWDDQICRYYNLHCGNE